MSCPKCGTHPNGEIGCCAPDGAWRGTCGDEGENKEHTWTEGWEACRRKNKIMQLAMCMCMSLFRKIWLNHNPVYVLNTEHRPQ